jgi:hypothetical protein
MQQSLSSIADSTQFIRESSWTMDEFEQFLDEFEVDLRKSGFETAREVVPEAEWEAWKRAVVHYLEGVWELRRYIKDPNERRLDEGLEICVYAHFLLKEAFDAVGGQAGSQGPRPGV